MTKKQQTVVITGGNSGIGYATAEEFLGRGYRVLITGRNPAAIQEAVHQLGFPAEGFMADQRSLEDTQRLAEYIRSRYGKIDVLIINAGVGKFGPFEATTEELFDEVMDINFKGAFFTTQQLLPLMNEGASIVFLSSSNAEGGMPGAAVHSASKAAINSLARTLSRELAPKGIRVNAIVPGPVDTPILQKAGLGEDALAHMAGRIPLGRVAVPAEIAKLAGFITSQDAAFITGAAINIDGGFAVHPLAG
ncbi:NAD(P)-dependent dehydrogenase (short-subunit alcohol dehydrogenase family) [Chitinophaga dinghuensis]|uniref:NAD(P)-dependent dehydrogenase (Short-subunit alcohol dehydrogenase family) n=1 Tax=Chitinophaga dinghuensis TaxID=1539050 RepID=A0A327VK42_9BACT|nr:SDR family oxidoreductase [Chitinophaga dinghuensis]RAJ73677.1 NAD(P)-dependent dehydrogenase (short-subunit alcohol dehydrogenase family) [Chitinophaga dinghuensis]